MGQDNSTGFSLQSIVIILKPTLYLPLEDKLLLCLFDMPNI
ncbi:hypothetical protein HMPREF1410_00128 [Helicobacter pylori GAM249T]|nr:hypothetical protein HMPREF1410_00128 [Helicobacter pylori GAM249T]